MGWNDAKNPGPWPAREMRPGETDSEHAFWVRYWEVLRTKGVAAGKEVWYERDCLRFIRELKPRRLKEATAGDVTQFLGLLAQQPDSAGWKVRQADQGLRILFQEMIRSAWAVQWPVGLPEMDGWMEGPEGGTKMPVPADAAQARFAVQVNKMIGSLRCLHYSYRTEEAYVDWARRFLSFARAERVEQLQGEVYLPEALSRKYPNASRQWAWQYVFPADRLSVDPRTGRVRRHHLCETTLQRAVSTAVRQAGICKAASCHSLRKVST